MGRRASVAAATAAMMVAWCIASVMSRNHLHARTPRDTHAWRTNSLREAVKEEVEGTGSQAAPSRPQQQADGSLDDSFQRVVSDAARTQRQEEWGQDPEVTPELFQGDIMGLSPEGEEGRLISNLYGSNEKQMILRALHTLDFLTCIKFVPWDEVVEDYLLIWPMEWPKGCWSYVGRKGGQQILSLQPPDSLSKGCFFSLGKPIHELLHAVGMFHEQARPDRDEHVDIITDNIIPRFLRNFHKQSAENTTFSYSYDYRSVLHYGKSFFSFIKGLPTIVPKVEGAKIGQRVMLSKLDCLKLNDVYGCLDDPFDREKYTAFCTFLGF
ncbi:Zinc metalloproteinase nas-14 [Chionoecetes opilio]|uniref:Metalloendopeptidase n=1 Tax=Chionoecetes opilio TaxID=41210 RepID=A0A8J8W9J3_CHIOP|nr:Zinc metalloproteinase nas-14 [Chionoecetes opilio]